jgi:hypothetical protein
MTSSAGSGTVSGSGIAVSSRFSHAQRVISSLNVDPTGAAVRARQEREAPLGNRPPSAGGRRAARACRRRNRLLEAERLEEDRAERVLLRHPAHLLGQASGEPEGGVVVRHRFARPCHLSEPGHRVDVPRERVVAVSRVLEEVAPVTEAATSSSATRNSGRYVRTGASRSTTPCSTSSTIAVAVNVFVVEPQEERPFVDGQAPASR